ncbi:MAG: class I SAM-dependent methyltransferase [Candidatus Odinarchaeota archaeon]
MSSTSSGYYLLFPAVFVVVSQGHLPLIPGLAPRFAREIPSGRDKMDRETGNNKSGELRKANRFTQEQFGREATKYASSKVHSDKEDLEWALHFIDPGSNWLVLDIATGAGHLALNLAPVVDRVIASDLTREMLTQAKKLASERNLNNIQTQFIDVHNIPYPDNTFDLVASRIAPHHFYDMEKAIREMVRVTKVNSFLFIQDTVCPEDKESADFINYLEKLRDPSHVRTLSKSRWEALLEKTGCQVIKSATRYKTWSLDCWTERMSTPIAVVHEIVRLLEQNYGKYRETVRIERAENYDVNELETNIRKWKICPDNGYFLARKVG